MCIQNWYGTARASRSCRVATNSGYAPSPEYGWPMNSTRARIGTYSPLRTLPGKIALQFSMAASRGLALFAT